MLQLSDGIERKFTESIDIDDWEIETDTGWEDISAIHKTIPYEKWIIKTTNCTLEAADTHILFDFNFNEIFLKDCIPNETYIITKNGPELVTSVENTNILEEMYDITVESYNHRFFTNNILSHNTTSIAVLMLWYVLFNSNFSVAVLAHKRNQSMEVLSRIQYAYELLPMWIQQGIITWNQGNIELENGSKIVTAATTGSSIRGQSHNIIYLDEFSHIPNNIQEEFFTSTYPVITSGKTTKVIITSTPHGLDLFYKLWVDSEQGRNEFVRTDIHWTAIPGRDEQWKQDQIKNIGASNFRVEFETEFEGSSSTLISGAKLRSIPFITPISESPNMWIYKRPNKNSTYVMTVDPATGVSEDCSAFVVFDITTMPYEVVCVYKNDTIPIIIFPQIIAQVAKDYNNAYVLVETNNNLGTQVVDLMHNDFEYDNLVLTRNHGRSGKVISSGFGDAKQEYGLCMTKITKRDGCANLKVMVESDQLIINDWNIYFEMGRFVQNKTQSYSADTGFHDDLMMCLVSFAWMATQPFIKEVNSIDFRRQLQKEQNSYVEQDVTPVGFFTAYEDNDGLILDVTPDKRKTFEELLWGDDDEPKWN